MVTQALHRRQVALGRSLARRDLPATCRLEAVDGTTGARTLVGHSRCRVVVPRGQDGVEWMGDERVVRVLVEADASTDGADLVVATDPVAGAVTYRVVAIDPPRSDDLLRSLSCVESREPGGPV